MDADPDVQFIEQLIRPRKFETSLADGPDQDVQRCRDAISAQFERNRAAHRELVGADDVTADGSKWTLSLSDDLTGDALTPRAHQAKQVRSLADEVAARSRALQSLRVR